MSWQQWTMAVVVILFAGALFLKSCADTDSKRTEVTPVLEATAPESTGPAESEEETVVELPDTSGIKLANATRGGR